MGLARGRPRSRFGREIRALAHTAGRRRAAARELARRNPVYRVESAQFEAQQPAMNSLAHPIRRRSSPKLPGKPRAASGCVSGVKKTGCSGFAYASNYADEVRRPTWCSKSAGRVIVDADSLRYVDGTEIDFVRQGLKSLQVRNPTCAASWLAARASTSNCPAGWNFIGCRSRGRYITVRFSGCPPDPPLGGSRIWAPFHEHRGRRPARGSACRRTPHLSIVSPHVVRKNVIGEVYRRSSRRA